MEAVHLKLARAEHHLDALLTEIEGFAQTNPYGIEHYATPDYLEHVFRLRVHRQPSPRLGIVIGDCIHNLRCALDHLTWELAGRPTGAKARQIQFPIYDSTDSYMKSRERRLAGVEDEARRVIERFQPWQRGDSPLHFAPHLLLRLQDLSNTDKHQSIHLIWPIKQKIRVLTSVKPVEEMLSPDPLVTDRTELVRFRFAEPHRDIDIAPTFVVAVQIRTLGTVVPLTPYLRGMLDLLRNQLVPALEPLALARAT